MIAAVRGGVERNRAEISAVREDAECNQAHGRKVPLAGPQFCSHLSDLGL